MEPPCFINIFLRSLAHGGFITLCIYKIIIISNLSEPDYCFERPRIDEKQSAIFVKFFVPPYPLHYINRLFGGQDSFFFKNPLHENTLVDL